MQRSRFLRACLLMAGLVVVAAACGSSSDGTTGTTTSASSESGVEVVKAWARTSAGSQTAGAAYMTITSDTDGAIVSASVPSEIAGTAELHETVADDAPDTSMEDMDHGDDMEGMDDDDMGAMTMREVAQIDLPAEEPVTMEPGGLHVMLLDLAEPLEAGQTFTVTLTLDDGTTVPVEVTVRDEAP